MHDDRIGSPPASRRRPGRLLIGSAGMVAFVLLLVPFFLPIPESLQRNLLFRTLGSQLHVPLMTGVTLVLYRWGPTARRLGLTIIAALAVGGGVELLQELCGRHMRWQDWAVDAVGIGLAVCLVCRRTRPRVAVIVAALLLAVVPLRMRELPAKMAAEKLAITRFPLLADFENAGDYILWGQAKSGRIHFPVRESGGRVLELIGEPPGRYPGAQLVGFPADWSGHRTLRWEARAADDRADSLAFVIRLDDFRSKEDGAFAAARFHVGGQWESFRLPLRELSSRIKTRPIQLDDVDALLFYLPDPDRTSKLRIDNVRLGP